MSMKQAFATFLFMAATSAFAHDAPIGWSYDLQCCSNRDCEPYPTENVRIEPDGYRLLTTGELLRYGDFTIKESPDGGYHRCAPAAYGASEHLPTRCFYVPRMGS